MSFPSRSEAERFLEEVVDCRNASPFPFKPEWEESFRTHCYGVARIAEAIASETLSLNPDKAYVMGLLHDCGRIKDEKGEKTHHGWEGYKLMMQKSWPELARICITHNFYEKDFDPATYPQAPAALLNCKNYLSAIEYDDYDKLIMLADLLNDMGKNCTIDYRFASLASRYPIQQETVDRFSAILKGYYDYFSSLCGTDIYQLLGIKNDLS